MTKIIDIHFVHIIQHINIIHQRFLVIIIIIIIFTTYDCIPGRLTREMIMVVHIIRRTTIVLRGRDDQHGYGGRYYQ